MHMPSIVKITCFNLLNYFSTENLSHVQSKQDYNQASESTASLKREAIFMVNIL